MLLRFISVRGLRCGDFIRHRGSPVRLTGNVSSMCNPPLAALTPNDGLTLQSCHSNRESVTLIKIPTHISSVRTCHVTKPCILQKSHQIRSFSTCVGLEQSVKRDSNFNPSNRRPSKFKHNRFKRRQYTESTEVIRPRRVKVSLVASLLLGEGGGKIGEQLSSTDENYEELDRMIEAVDTDSDEFASSDSESEFLDKDVVDHKDEDAISDTIEFVEEVDLRIEDDSMNDGETTESKQSKNDSYGGYPDPTVPISDTPCSGCGALLHCQNTSIPGYIPSQKFLHWTKNHPHKLRLQICQRCYLMNTHDLALKSSVTSDEYKEIIAHVKSVQALVIVVVDVMDMPNSIFPDITDLIGKNRPLYIVGNKADLLPQDGVGYLRHAKEVLIQQCEEAGLTTNSYIKHVGLISAKTGFGIEELATKLLTDWGRKGHVYLLGCTNVGKSSLFNALLSSDMCKSTAIDFINRATTSIWPGTTLNLLRFPLTNPEPWKLVRRTKRLKVQKTVEQEEKQFLRMKYKEGDPNSPEKYPTLMGHIGRTFEGTRNVAVGEEDSKGWSGPTFSFDTDAGGIVASERVDFERMEGFKYDETHYAKSRWCYDTPGVVNDNQILTELTQHELAVVLTQETIVPRSFILKPGQSMHMSGLARIDYITGKKSVYFTVFAAKRVPVSVRETSEIDAFYERHIGTNVMGVPLGDAARLAQLPPLVGKDMTLVGENWSQSVADIILSSIGWVAVTPGAGLNADLRVYTPGGRGCTLRSPPLLPYAVNLRGKRSRSAAYKIRPLRIFE